MAAAAFLTLLWTDLAFAQFDAPHQPDDQTMALWNMNFRLPDSLDSHSIGIRDRSLEAYHTIIGDDGSIFIAGSSNRIEADKDFLLVKLNDEFETVWLRTYGGGGEDFCESMAQLPNGNLVLAGTTDSFGEGGYDYWMLAADQNGDSLYSQSYGGPENDLCHSVVSNEDGSFLLGGSSSSFIESVSMWILKINEDFEIVWSEFYSPTEVDICGDIVRNDANGYIAGGSAAIPNGEGVNGSFVSIDQNGERLWSRQYGQNSDAWCQALAKAGDRIAFTGVNDGGYWTGAFNDEGGLLWSDVIEREHSSVGYDIVSTIDGGLCVCGKDDFYIDENQRERNGKYGMLKYDCEGNLQWDIAFGGEDHLVPRSIIQRSDASYLLTGGAIGEHSSEILIVETTPELSGITDLSAFNNHCSIIGDLAWGWVDSVWKHALNIAHESPGFLIIEDDLALHLQEFTIEARVKLDEEINHEGAIVCKPLAEERFSYYLSVASEGELYFILGGTEDDCWIRASVDLGVDRWNHIACSYDGRKMQLFFNGVRVADRDLDTRVEYDEHPVLIGAGSEFIDDEYQFFGQIDEVRISNTVRDCLGVNERFKNQIDLLSAKSLDCHPNPFNAILQIDLTLPNESEYEISVYDLNGRFVRRLQSGKYMGFKKRIIWRPENLSCGSYIIYARNNNSVYYKSVLHLK